MGNTGNIGIHKESKSIGNENDHAHSQSTSSTTSQNKVSLGSVSKKCLISKAPDAEKGCTENLSEEFVETSSITLIEGVVTEPSKDSCDQQYMEWIKLRGPESRPRNRMKETSETLKLKCWTDNELFLNKAPELSFDETEPTDGIEKRRSTDFFSVDDSDSCLKDARYGSISYTVISDLSVAGGRNSKISVPCSEIRASNSLTASWEQEPSSDESVKNLYSHTRGSGFDKGLQKHTECKESADRIQFKTKYFSGSTNLGVSGKKSGSPTVLRPRIKVNHRTPVVQQILKTD